MYNDTALAIPCADGAAPSAFRDAVKPTPTTFRDAAQRRADPILDLTADRIGRTPLHERDALDIDVRWDRFEAASSLSKRRTWRRPRLSRL